MLEYFCVSGQTCWENVIFMLTRALFPSIDIVVIASIERAGDLEALFLSPRQVRQEGPAIERRSH
jgi:hypothetical protein